MSDKPLPPTDKRLRDARAEGNVARSDVLTGLIVAALTVEVAFACLDAGIERWLALQGDALAQLNSPDRIGACFRLLVQGGGLIAVAVGRVAAAAVIAAALAAWACGGISFAPKAVKPSLKRFNAIRHLKGLFGAKNLTAVALAIATAFFVGAAAYWQLSDRLPILGAMIEWQSLEFDRQAGIATLHAFVRALIAALLVPALLSTIVARRQHRRSLRMSHRDLREELKQASGDPATRARLRASSIEAATAPSLSGTRHGHALVTNPEHVAVLLHYAGDAAQPPIVVAKAVDDEAMRMTNAALLDRVPVFRFRRLARHLCQHGDPQAAIPPECYRAVAIVYRVVEEIEGLAERPNVPIEIDDAVFEA